MQPMIAMRLGVFLTEVIKALYGRYVDDLPESCVRDAVERSIRILRHFELSCAEILVGSLRALELVAKATSEVEGFDFQLHEMGEFSGKGLSLADSSARRRAVEGIKAMIDCASDGGIRVVTIHPPTYNPGEPGYAYQAELHKYLPLGEALASFVKHVRELSAYALRRGVTLSLENMPRAVLDGHVIKRVPCLGIEREEVLKLLSEAGGGKLGLTLDVGHANTVCQPSDYVRGIVNRVVHIHLHDNDGRYDQHAPLGTGTVNLYLLAKVLMTEGYKESVVIERGADGMLFEDVATFRRYLRLARRPPLGARLG